ncbi:MAG TPA: hypothetical protein VH333_00715 [Pseudonocardiaceae bacterium]|jgi:hypothetical protein|nr:hypothetical protein [Pseudonocardiaceae bacterium]
MGKIHPGATLTPHFRDFLPAWLVGQPWYFGTGALAVRPVGYFRFEDPAGEVGMETHLVENDGVLYQVPMTYRDAPLPTAGTQALITTAEHSVLGTRYIYDGQADPLYLEQLLQIVDTNGVSDPSLKRGAGPAEARGVRHATRPRVNDRVRVELVRVLTPSAPPPDDVDVAGLLIGIWHPDPDSSATATGCLAVVRTARETA